MNNDRLRWAANACNPARTRGKSGMTYFDVAGDKVCGPTRRRFGSGSVYSFYFVLDTPPRVVYSLPTQHGGAVASHTIRICTQRKENQVEVGPAGRVG